MSGTHSKTMAEERLVPSLLQHKTSLHKITSTTTTAGQQEYHSTIISLGPGGVEPQGAFEVPKRKRILQITLAVIYCLLAAGIVFGYAALKPILISEGVYRDKCTSEEIANGTRVCYQQGMRLNFMFTIAAVATNVCALLVGTILDQYGPRVAGVIGSFLFAAGCTGMAFGRNITVIDPYPISYLLMAVGGPFIFIPSFHLANAFPRHSGMILSLLTGAFDASSAIFLLYRLLYQYLGQITLRQWFLAYLFVPLLILFTQLLIMPKISYKTCSELSSQAAVESDLSTNPSVPVIQRSAASEIASEIDALLGGPDGDFKRTPSHHLKLDDRETAGVWGVLHDVPVSQQLRSFWFWGIAGFTIIQMLRINYFVATVRTQYEFLFHNYEDAITLNTFFDIALPLGGLAAIPFIGIVLDSLSTLTVLSVLVTTATTIGVLGLVENSYIAAYANVILFVMYRPFYYTVVSDYCAKVFGTETFGKVYGAVICLAGLFGLSQQGLDWVTYHAGGDPRAVNAGLLMAGVLIGAAVVGWVAKGGRRGKRGARESDGAGYGGV
ncbi:major facilitator superfamily domain-containing protein [Pyronema domesticum]|uniref:Similar to Protein FMP42 acc. no. Q04991 n=1 Tax=Pyronema omphalodes (strain CBS 100304) TaxID=1076935 RepID=U4LH92_PYROM|nr:major facilitator superfamily domain-containing protein [Pyronema domesticum]CCX31484.1 Similar to Protein FMP42; acc. no. Q04991 [Pyronema omphalodes CBS 100304]